MHPLNESTSAANMVIPSKEIASAAPITSPRIVCWNTTGHAFRDPCHIHSSVCQIDNLMPSSKTFVRKYTSTRAFQIPIKLGTVKAHALINTIAQCSILSSGLVKYAFDKQSLQLWICGKIKVADGAVVNAHGPVVVTMESAFREHMIKWVILDDDGNNQCIIGTNFLSHPDIHAILNFKENYIKIQDMKLPLKVIALVRSQMELFLNAPNDNILQEIPEEERVSFSGNKSYTFSQPEEIEAEQPSPQLHPSVAGDAQYIAMEEHYNAFEGIKKALTSSPFLRYPVYDGKAQFVTQIEASMTAIGAILYQESGNDQWVIAYNSCILTNAET
uniref:Reverse transcriptase/retrotransposon-derived protein RNase H-like domain-containing protein n=1 Tax=Romanomermis culicivorax TaxID=13658 RepID=A0A915HVD6_ROMCU